MPNDAPESDAELDAIFVPTKRVSLWPFVVGVTVIVALAGIGVRLFAQQEEAKVRLDPETVRQVRDVLPLIESKVPTERGPWISAVLVDLLEDRVPGGVRNGLREVQQVPPDYQQLAWMKVLANKSVVRIWRPVCAKAGEVLAEVAQSGRKDGGLVMYQRCNFHEIGLLDVGRALESGPAEILLAHALYRHLEKEGTLTPIDERALRLLARTSSYRTGTTTEMNAPTASTSLPRRSFDLPPPPPDMEDL